jgi:hypothetical protein
MFPPYFFFDFFLMLMPISLPNGFFLAMSFNHLLERAAPVPPLTFWPGTLPLNDTILRAMRLQ